MSDKGALADPLGHSEGLVKRAMQHQADAARLGRLRVGELQLAENLRLADDHRVEARADAEQMPRCFTAGETVYSIAPQISRDASIRGQKFARRFAAAAGIPRHSNYFDAVAGRDQRSFRDRLRRRT